MPRAGLRWSTAASKRGERSSEDWAWPRDVGARRVPRLLVEDDEPAHETAQQREL